MDEEPGWPNCLPEVQGGELAVEVFVENRPTQAVQHAGLMWYYDDDHYVTLNKEQIDGKPTVLWVVEKAGIPQPPFGDTPYQNDGIWLPHRTHCCTPRAERGCPPGKF